MVEQRLLVAVVGKTGADRAVIHSSNPYADRGHVLLAQSLRIRSLLLVQTHFRSADIRHVLPGARTEDQLGLP